MDNWHHRFWEEIKQANIARSEGNEGKARVCARRAANVLLQYYFYLQDIPATKNAIKNLTLLQNYLNVSHPAYPIVSHLLLRVNEEFQLPQEIDLIKDVLQLKEILLPENPLEA
ncbi:MAG: hypothetical protein ACPL3P_04440 [Anaerolineales bacterium]